ncbi:hypothetical protein JCM10207_002378 [Rhodosporidiobolus poonsookiae]
MVLPPPRFSTTDTHTSLKDQLSQDPLLKLIPRHAAPPPPPRPAPLPPTAATSVPASRPAQSAQQPSAAQPARAESRQEQHDKLRHAATLLGGNPPPRPAPLGEQGQPFAGTSGRPAGAADASALHMSAQSHAPATGPSRATGEARAPPHASGSGSRQEAVPVVPQDPDPPRWMEDGLSGRARPGAGVGGEVPVRGFTASGNDGRMPRPPRPVPPSPPPLPGSRNFRGFVPEVPRHPPQQFSPPQREPVPIVPLDPSVALASSSRATASASEHAKKPEVEVIDLLSDTDDESDPVPPRPTASASSSSSANPPPYTDRPGSPRAPCVWSAEAAAASMHRQHKRQASASPAASPRRAPGPPALPTFERPAPAPPVFPSPAAMPPPPARPAQITHMRHLASPFAVGETVPETPAAWGAADPEEEEGKEDAKMEEPRPEKEGGEDVEMREAPKEKSLEQSETLDPRATPLSSRPPSPQPAAPAPPCLAPLSPSSPPSPTRMSSPTASPRAPLDPTVLTSLYTVLRLRLHASSSDPSRAVADTLRLVGQSRALSAPADAVETSSLARFLRALETACEAQEASKGAGLGLREEEWQRRRAVVRRFEEKAKERQAEGERVTAGGMVRETVEAAAKEQEQAPKQVQAQDAAPAPDRAGASVVDQARSGAEALLARAVRVLQRKASEATAARDAAAPLTAGSPAFKAPPPTTAPSAPSSAPPDRPLVPPAPAPTAFPNTFSPAHRTALALLPCGLAESLFTLRLRTHSDPASAPSAQPNDPTKVLSWTFRAELTAAGFRTEPDRLGAVKTVAALLDEEATQGGVSKETVRVRREIARTAAIALNKRKEEAAARAAPVASEAPPPEPPVSVSVRVAGARPSPSAAPSPPPPNLPVIPAAARPPSPVAPPPPPAEPITSTAAAAVADFFVLYYIARQSPPLLSRTAHAGLCSRLTAAVAARVGVPDRQRFAGALTLALEREAKASGPSQEEKERRRAFAEKWVEAQAAVERTRSAAAQGDSSGATPVPVPETAQAQAQVPARGGGQDALLARWKTEDEARMEELLVRGVREGQETDESDSSREATVAPPVQPVASENPTCTNCLAEGLACDGNDPCARCIERGLFHLCGYDDDTEDEMEEEQEKPAAGEKVQEVAESEIGTDLKKDTPSPALPQYRPAPAKSAPAPFLTSHSSASSSDLHLRPPVMAQVHRATPDPTAAPYRTPPPTRHQSDSSASQPAAFLTTSTPSIPSTSSAAPVQPQSQPPVSPHALSRSQSGAPASHPIQRQPSGAAPAHGAAQTLSGNQHYASYAIASASMGAAGRQRSQSGLAQPPAVQQAHRAALSVQQLYEQQQLVAQQRAIQQHQHLATAQRQQHDEYAQTQRQQQNAQYQQQQQPVQYQHQPAQAQAPLRRSSNQASYPPSQPGQPHVVQPSPQIQQGYFAPQPSRRTSSSSLHAANHRRSFSGGAQSCVLADGFVAPPSPVSPAFSDAPPRQHSRQASGSGQGQYAGGNVQYAPAIASFNGQQYAAALPVQSTSSGSAQYGYASAASSSSGQGFASYGAPQPASFPPPPQYSTAPTAYAPAVPSALVPTQPLDLAAYTPTPGPLLSQLSTAYIALQHRQAQERALFGQHCADALALEQAARGAAAAGKQGEGHGKVEVLPSTVEELEAYKKRRREEEEEMERELRQRTTG